MEIPEQTLTSLIEEGLNLLTAGYKVQNCESIHWYIKSKFALDQLGLKQEVVDKFKYSLDIEERVKILQLVAQV